MDSVKMTISSKTDAKCILNSSFYFLHNKFTRAHIVRNIKKQIRDNFACVQKMGGGGWRCGETHNHAG
jgi:hypothetical protein